MRIRSAALAVLLALTPFAVRIAAAQQSPALTKACKSIPASVQAVPQTDLLIASLIESNFVVDDLDFVLTSDAAKLQAKQNLYGTLGLNLVDTCSRSVTIFVIPTGKTQAEVNQGYAKVMAFAFAQVTLWELKPIDKGLIFHIIDTVH